ncbi:2-amino-4-hydroxy-6-hydroxymethyldihydropteridine pyrophosphokinase [Marinobacter litoralis]|uniref:2-amino-4-hydroxy-6-hydroxymethyldihydropteridine diphosphokinase n=1 Tax=Marinobacter litoralis TaxID=187981 RepID=A0A3M2RBI3_9GAMM|nr:2-amino-4-hydroxy-6-hydroxymethyldihydropteridine diphosphokinase [Marinobacter litoralis]RMJ02529.1 2-amino-4-hydroxy-6-hydroxymethyldihydropteridine pyrophosphokinase [Marinobacter litoralis]
MARVLLGIGSNVERYRHVGLALDALQNAFGELSVSPVYESEPVGFSGSNFLNLAVGFHTELQVAELSRLLKQMELDFGRRPDAPRFSPRTLDLDILTYGDEVGLVAGVELPRGEILKNAFVLKPLADIAPETKHPVNGKSYSELWQYYAADQKLWPVDFIWQERQISAAIG